MKRQLNLLYSLLLACLMLGVASCSDDSPTDPGDGNGNGNGEPTISTFTASPASLSVGNPTTLAWTITDATTISIDQGLGVQTGTSVMVYPSATTTYTLTATNSKGTTTKSVTVEVTGTIDRVELTPSSPQTLQPGGTMQFTAKAYSNANVDLALPQSAFTWTSNNTTLAQVSQSGTVTIPSTVTAGGLAQITASVGGVSSSPVSVNVQLQKATTLVIYHPRDASDDDWSAYTSAFIGHSVDVLYDAPDLVPTAISLEQIEGYERVFYFTHEDNPLHASTRQMLRLYAQMPNKRLILMGNSNVLSDDNAFLALLGIERETWHPSNQVNTTFTGGAGTAMEGFTFDFSNDWDYISELTLMPTNPGLAALTTTSLDGEVWAVAVQKELTGGSKVYYGGFVLENVQTNLRDDYITRLMNF